MSDNNPKLSLDRLGNDGLERLKKVTPENIASQQSSGINGAEQERWQAHFGLNDPESVKEAATELLKSRGIGAEQDVHAGHFGLGYDGKERVRQMLDMKGIGAEQDRYAGHFGLDSDTIRKAQERLAKGMEQNQGAESMS